jgi:cytidine deaminase
MAARKKDSASDSPGAEPSARGKSSDDGIENLLGLATAASRLAHSPYSKIEVGAALQARDGQVFTGCNVENASYGLTLCAERVAMVKAISAGAREFDAIAIVTNQAKTLMPCGACRQFLHEFAPQLIVVCQGATGPRQRAVLSDLLPRAFGPDDLE